MTKRKFYFLAASFTVASMFTAFQTASADDYYAILSAPQAIPSSATVLTAPTLLTTTTTYPAVIATTTASPVVIEDTATVVTGATGVCSMPGVLIKTSRAKPPHLFSFGVWP